MPRQEPHRRPLILVEWLDSSSNNKWRRVEEVAAEGDNPMRCRSVGWLIAKTKTQIVLGSSLSGGHDDFREHVTGDIAIPLGCVTKTAILRR